MTHGYWIDQAWNLLQLPWEPEHVAVILAALFTGWQAFLTRQLLKHQRMPMLIAVDVAGRVQIQNIGNGLAMTSCVYAEGADRLRYASLAGDIPAGATVPPNIQVWIHSDDSWSTYLYYQDTAQRWHCTRCARDISGRLASQPLGPRYPWGVPASVREKMFAETTVEWLRRRQVTFWVQDQWAAIRRSLSGRKK